MISKLSTTVLIFIFLNLFLYSLNAQSFQWVRHQTINITFNPDLTSFITETDLQGNSLLGSIHNYKQNFGSGYYGDVSIKKFDPSGNLLLNKIFYGKILIDNLQSDRFGNIYVSGSFMDTLRIDSINYILNTGSGFNLNYFIIKLNNNGSFLWKKNINVLYPSFPGLDVIKIKGNYLFAGVMNSFAGYIKKFDLNGTEVMSISQSPVRGISGIDVDSQGNIYAGGACQNGNINFAGHTDVAPHTYNVYFVKYAPDGSYMWARFVEDITFQNVDIACDKMGNLFAAGTLWGAFMFGKIQAQGKQWVYDFFLTKLDPSGNFLWVKEVPNTQTITGDAGKGKVNAIAIDMQDNIYLSGFFRGTVNWGNGVITTASPGIRDILLLKYDQNGNILLGKRAGGMGGNRSDDIAIDNAGNVFMAGNFSSTATFDSITASGSGNVNSFLTKMSSGLTMGSINLSLIMEGFYNLASDNMRLKDTVTIYLRNSSSPYLIADTSVSVIDPDNFTGEFTIDHASAGNYYIQIKHRNCVETWSSQPVNYSFGGIINYNFTTSSSMAFGNNIIAVNNSPERFAIYSGDVTQDGIVDASDLAFVDNEAFNFTIGYVPTDLTGDFVVDASDAAIAGNNAFNFISKVSP